MNILGIIEDVNEIGILLAIDFRNFKNDQSVLSEELRQSYLI